MPARRASARLIISAVKKINRRQENTRGPSARPRAEIIGGRAKWLEKCSTTNQGAGFVRRGSHLSVRRCHRSRFASLYRSPRPYTYVHAHLHIFYFPVAASEQSPEALLPPIYLPNRLIICPATPASDLPPLAATFTRSPSEREHRTPFAPHHSPTHPFAKWRTLDDFPGIARRILRFPRRPREIFPLHLSSFLCGR